MNTEVGRMLYHSERDSIRQQLAALKPVEVHRHDLSAVAEYLRHPAEAWEAGNDTERNALLATMARSIVVRDGEVMEVRMQPDVARLFGLPCVEAGT